MSLLVRKSILGVIVVGSMLVSCDILDSKPQDALEHTCADGPVDPDDDFSCTGGNVPAAATKCKLDLGSGMDSWWVDTDGVDEGTAGCHLEMNSTYTARVTRMGGVADFGEFCLDGNGGQRIVESNPGVLEGHRHGGDIGRPLVRNCDTYCVGLGTGGGACQAVTVTGNHPCGVAYTCTSARCECYN